MKGSRTVRGATKNSSILTKIEKNTYLKVENENYYITIVTKFTTLTK